MDQTLFQEPNTPLQSNWPEPYFNNEEKLLNHPDFAKICENLFKHKNNVISSRVMIKIWGAHCEGASLRELENLYDIPNPTIFRAIRKLRGIIDLMDLDQDKVISRSYAPDVDNPFIFSTWRNAVWFDTHKNNEIDHVFYRVMTKRVRSIIDNPHMDIKIACLKSDKNFIVGYSVLDHDTIKFVYIKIDYRGQGIAKLLTKGFIDIDIPETKIGKAIAVKHSLKIKENEDAKEESREA